MYIGNHLSYKPGIDLYIQKFSFIELINIKKSNVTFPGIYRHRNMDLDEINGIYLDPILNKTLKERSTFLLGDFEVDLLMCNHHVHTNEFVESLSYHIFLHSQLELSTILKH